LPITDDTESPYYRAAKDETGKVIESQATVPNRRSLWPLYLLLSLIPVLQVFQAEVAREQHNALAWREYEECRANQFMLDCKYEKW